MSAIGVRFHPTLIVTFATLVSSLVSASGFAQVRIGNNSIYGTVFDSVTGAPLSSANVFLRATTKGTITQSDGNYELAGLPDGEYELIVSLLGYEREALPVKLWGSVHQKVNAGLKAKAIGLSQVVITASAEEWQRLLPAFKDVFLGTTDNAKECTIKNPEVIGLSVGSTGDSVKARTESTLVIDNNALGYRIYVQIDSCIVIANRARFAMRWYPRYEELKPADADQENEWKVRRQECYRYSFTRFIRSTLNHRLREDGFRVSTGEVGDLLRAKGDEASDNQIRITPFSDSTILGIDFTAEQVRVDRLDEFGSWKASMEFLALPENPLQSISSGAVRSGPEIRSRGVTRSTPANGEAMTDRVPQQEKMVERYSSIVRIKERPLLVDKEGNLVKSFSVVLNGFWETRRLADTLPYDYAPE